MDLTILYGSQTGNAEDMAKRIGHKAKRLGLKVLVEAMDDFPLRLLPRQSLIVFVCSTTGHGQESENMKNLYNFVRRRDLPSDCLSSLKYAVYGLGDSSYTKFNYISKILFKRLKECGAEPIQDLVAGDEQHQYGCDGVIYPKLDELWKKLNLEVTHDLSQKLPANSYDITLFTENEANLPDTSVNKFTEDYAKKYNLRLGYCITNQRLTDESHFQDTRFIRLKSDVDINYLPGDVCSILPVNDDENVDEFIRLLNLDPQQRFAVIKKDPNYMVNYLYDFIPNGLRVRDLVRYYLDIQSIPRRSFFEFLWPFSDDELERGKLKEFASTEGQEELYEYCVQPKRSILEVLLDFPHTVRNIDFKYILDLIPPIKPRSFSIASSLGKHPGEVHLIVGVVSYQTRLKKIRKGLCSNYIAGLKQVASITNAPEDSKLRFFLKPTTFKLPNDASVPIIMVGPGLGIAPFRSFIQERARLGHSSNYLYFGCRFDDKDFYFKSEFYQYVDQDQLLLRVAFSRERPKRYVQDLLSEDAELIRRMMIEKKAMFYVAGNSKLPEELRSILAKILGGSEHGDVSITDGDSLVARLEARNVIQYDCW